MHESWTTMFSECALDPGTSNFSIWKSLSKDYLQNPPKQKPHSKIRSRTLSRRPFREYSTRTRTQTVLSQTRRVRTATRNGCTSITFLMRYICITHTLVDAPDIHLKEEEKSCWVRFSRTTVRPVAVVLRQDIQDEVACYGSRG